MNSGPTKSWFHSRISAGVCVRVRVPQKWVQFNSLRGLSPIEREKLSDRGTTEFLRNRVEFIDQAAKRAGLDILKLLAVSFCHTQKRYTIEFVGALCEVLHRVESCLGIQGPPFAPKQCA